ncbi:MAG: hypothetical protein ABIF11_10390 [Nitrospirota bacterium]
MNNDNIRLNIEKLETLAQEVLKIKKLSRPRRPIVIEFCGTPKSGKTSCITSLNIFLKRNGFKTKVLTERAGVCPITDKFDPSFNIWTISTAIAQLLEFLSEGAKNMDVIIADRGIFDGLCWFEWHLKQKHIETDNYDALINYLTMKKWRTVVDLICVFTVSPEKSIEREYIHLLTTKRGSIMNEKILEDYNLAISEAIDKYNGIFRKIEVLDTNNIAQNEVSYKVTNNVLEILKEIIVEQIGYFEKNSFSNKETQGYFYHSKSLFQNIKISYNRRDEVENNPELIQPVAIAVITNKAHNEFLVVKKKQSSLGLNSPEADKLLVYVGGHIRKEDNVYGNSENLISIAKTALSREIKEELGTSLRVNNEPPLCIWIKDNSKSEQHIAICFVVEIDFKQLNCKLDEYEFIQKRGRTDSGKTMSISELISKKNELEKWSEIILKTLFNINIDKEPQRDLFKNEDNQDT